MCGPRVACSRTGLRAAVAGLPVAARGPVWLPWPGGLGHIGVACAEAEPGAAHGWGTDAQALTGRVQASGGVSKGQARGFEPLTPWSLSVDGAKPPAAKLLIRSGDTLWALPSQG